MTEEHVDTVDVINFDHVDGFKNSNKSQSPIVVLDFAYLVEGLDQKYSAFTWHAWVQLAQPKFSQAWVALWYGGESYYYGPMHALLYSRRLDCRHGHLVP